MNNQNNRQIGKFTARKQITFMSHVQFVRVLVQLRIKVHDVGTEGAVDIIDSENSARR